MRTTIFIIFIFFILMSVSGFAQNRSAEADTSQSANVKQEDVKLFIDKIEIEGQLEKPQAVFILPGQTPDIDDIQIERSFMQDIFRPIEKRTTVETKYRAAYTKKRKDVIEW